ncbi:MAG TPA: hypothetical protein VFU68_00015, partial [Terracidiphilus sp.]|nr:hypothetical protein [Terracidiphilus sp.]
MRLTIERLRTMVLAAGILLVSALVLFLAIGRWRNPLSTKDLPKKLGVNIQQDFSGVTYTQARGGKTLFKIHASKVVQLKAGNALLNDVEIELYGEDGTRVDRIVGNEFEYDEHAGIAKATGPVKITLMRPAVATAITPKTGETPVAGADKKQSATAEPARRAARVAIEVETSGLVFERDLGIARTDQRVEFRMAQSSGSALGAELDSNDGRMALGRDVVMNALRDGAPVRLTAQHAEFDRDAKVCRMRGADASYKGGEAQAQEVAVTFRADGSAESLTAGDGLLVTTATGVRLAAPRGLLQFDAHSQPRAGHLEGGVTFNSAEGGRKVQGSSPLMDLAFSGGGALRGAHMEQGVRIKSEELGQTLRGRVETKREWTSPVADLAFGSMGNGQLRLESMHGIGGVVMTGETRRGNGPAIPSRMSADEVTASFGKDSALTEIVGKGSAEIEETAENGARQSTRGDRLTAQFAGAKNSASRVGRGGSA